MIHSNLHRNSRENWHKNLATNTAPAVKQMGYTIDNAVKILSTSYELSAAHENEIDKIAQSGKLTI
jgi:hypothetical protein